jgi:hypothetical protein
MKMGVRLTQRIVRSMRVVMMCIVNMPMLVIERLVVVFVFVRLSQMEVEANRHEDAGDYETRGQWLTKHQEC